MYRYCIKEERIEYTWADRYSVVEWVYHYSDGTREVIRRRSRL